MTMRNYIIFTPKYNKKIKHIVRHTSLMDKLNESQADLDEIVKVSHDESGIHLGCWNVGIESNKVNRTKFLKAGAHFVISDIKDLPIVISEINDLLLQNITPVKMK
jgi:hypothetical protein